MNKGEKMYKQQKNIYNEILGYIYQTFVNENITIEITYTGDCEKFLKEQIIEVSKLTVIASLNQNPLYKIHIIPDKAKQNVCISIENEYLNYITSNQLEKTITQLTIIQTELPQIQDFINGLITEYTFI